MASGQGAAPLPSATRGTAEGVRVGEQVIKKSRYDVADSANGARPDHNVLTRREYGLLAPEGSTVNTAATGPLGIGDNPKETTDTGSTKGTETGTG